MTALTAAAAVLLLILTAAVAVPTVDRIRARHTALTRRVVVVLTTGDTLDGILVARTTRQVTLRQASVVSGERRVSADGVVLIDPHMIAWIQAPEGV